MSVGREASRYTVGFFFFFFFYKQKPAYDIWHGLVGGEMLKREGVPPLPKPRRSSYNAGGDVEVTLEDGTRYGEKNTTDNPQRTRPKFGYH